MNQTRRDFLRRAGVAVTSAAAAATIDQLTLTSAMAQTGGPYKALVCIFFGGGNDGNNMVIPVGNNPDEYPLYNAARGAARGNLALTQAALAATNITPLNLGRPFALHPNFAQRFSTYDSIHTLWNNNRVAVICNTGPLVRPLTSPTPRQAYISNPSLRPYQLFSHSDQVQIYQTSSAARHVPHGWGGRFADRLLADGITTSPIGFPIVTTAAGVAHYTIGTSTRPLAVPGSGNLNGVLSLGGYGNIGLDPEYSRRYAFDISRQTARGNNLVRITGDIMDQALQLSEILRVNPTITTTFPATGLGNQLLQVARIIKINQDLQPPSNRLNRQIFYVSIGGFDTHNNQLNGQGNLFTQISQAVSSFYQATVELGMADRVTTFTMSDFNRTFDPASPGGNVGSDHAWGAHHLVIGGAVRGRYFYGVNGPNGSPFPLLKQRRDYPEAEAIQDAGNRGLWIPTTSVEQYANTLAAWFGLPQDDTTLNYIFPNLIQGGFAPRTLGFML